MNSLLKPFSIQTWCDQSYFILTLKAKALGKVVRDRIPFRLTNRLIVSHLESDRLANKNTNLNLIIIIMNKQLTYSLINKLLLWSQVSPFYSGLFMTCSLLSLYLNVIVTCVCGCILWCCLVYCYLLLYYFCL